MFFELKIVNTWLCYFFCSREFFSWVFSMQRILLGFSNGFTADSPWVVLLSIGLSDGRWFLFICSRKKIFTRICFWNHTLSHEYRWPISPGYIRCYPVPILINIGEFSTPPACGKTEGIANGDMGRFHKYRGTSKWGYPIILP